MMAGVLPNHLDALHPTLLTHLQYRDDLVKEI
jgi:hypothetical protein